MLPLARQRSATPALPFLLSIPGASWRSPVRRPPPVNSVASVPSRRLVSPGDSFPPCSPEFLHHGDGGHGRHRCLIRGYLSVGILPIRWHGFCHPLVSIPFLDRRDDIPGCRMAVVSSCLTSYLPGFAQ